MTVAEGAAKPQKAAGAPKAAPRPKKARHKKNDRPGPRLATEQRRLDTKARHKKNVTKTYTDRLARGELKEVGVQTTDTKQTFNSGQVVVVSETQPLQRQKRAEPRRSAPLVRNTSATPAPVGYRCSGSVRGPRVPETDWEFDTPVRKRRRD